MQTVSFQWFSWFIEWFSSCSVICALVFLVFSMFFDFFIGFLDVSWFVQWFYWFNLFYDIPCFYWFVHRFSCFLSGFLKCSGFLEWFSWFLQWFYDVAYCMLQRCFWSVSLNHWVCQGFWGVSLLNLHFWRIGFVTFGLVLNINIYIYIII